MQRNVQREKDQMPHNARNMKKIIEKEFLFIQRRIKMNKRACTGGTRGGEKYQSERGERDRHTTFPYDVTYVAETARIQTPNISRQGHILKEWDRLRN